MAKQEIRRGKLEDKHQGHLRRALIVLHEDGRTRYRCRWVDFVLAKPDEDYWMCVRGRRILSMRPATGRTLSALDEFLLTYTAQKSYRSLYSSRPPHNGAPSLARQVFDANLYRENVEECGHYGIFFFDDEEELGILSELDEQAIQDYAKDALKSINALRAIGADAFADILSEAAAFWTEQVAAGTLAERKPEWFAPYDEAFRAIRPTLNEHLQRFIETHRTEIYSDLT